MALAPAAPAGAQDLDAARKQLTTLERRITSTEARVASLQAQLRALSAQVGREQGDLVEIQGNLASTSARIEDVQQKLGALRGKMRTRVRNLYKRGPLQLVGIVLGAESVSEFVERMTYANKLAAEDYRLVLESREKQAELKRIQAYQIRLEREQTSTLATLRSRQTSITDVFAEQQGVLADLAKDRAEALQLVERLETQLAAGDLASLRRVAGRGMTISYGEWAQSFLATVGAPVVRSNLVAVVAWEASEGTQATWNPLATTMHAPGATVHNSHGVRNYRSKEQGIDATIRTLRLPNRGYEPILNSLEQGAKAMDTGRAINRSLWCRGCAGGSYVIGIIPAVEKYYDRYAS